jgi:hypothetical protein
MIGLRLYVTHQQCFQHRRRLLKAHQTHAATYTIMKSIFRTSCFSSTRSDSPSSASVRKNSRALSPSLKVGFSMDPSAAECERYTISFSGAMIGSRRPQKKEMRWNERTSNMPINRANHGICSPATQLSQHKPHPNHDKTPESRITAPRMAFI